MGNPDPLLKYSALGRSIEAFDVDAGDYVKIDENHPSYTSSIVNFIKDHFTNIQQEQSDISKLMNIDYLSEVNVSIKTIDFIEDIRR